MSTLTPKAIRCIWSFTLALSSLRKPTGDSRDAKPSRPLIAATLAGQEEDSLSRCGRLAEGSTVAAGSRKGLVYLPKSAHNQRLPRRFGGKREILLHGSDCSKIRGHLGRLDRAHPRGRRARCARAPAWQSNGRGGVCDG